MLYQSVFFVRLDAIARDAELSEQSEADLKRLGQKLHNKLLELANNKFTADNQVSEKLFISKCK